MQGLPSVSGMLIVLGISFERVAHHHLDMEIIRDDYGPRYISVFRLLHQTVIQSSAKKTDPSEKKTISPLLSGLIMHSILTNHGLSDIIIQRDSEPCEGRRLNQFCQSWFYQGISTQIE